MYIKDTLGEKAAEGKSLVVEFGVYIMETLGSVGLPAEQVAAALLSFRPAAKVNSDSVKEKKKKKKRPRRKLEDKNGAAGDNQQLIRSGRRSREHSESKSGGGDLFQRALRFVIEARSSSPQQVISRILFYLADALGEPLDRPSQRDLERAVGAFVEEAHSHRGGRVTLEHIPQPLSRRVTGVVLSYHERDDIKVPAHTLNKIRRGMHFNIPIRPFDATVQLLPPPKSRQHSRGGGYEYDDEYDFDFDDEDPEDELESSLLVEKQYKKRPAPVSSKSAALVRIASSAPSQEFDRLYQQDLEEQDLIGRMMAHNRHSVSECVVPCTPSSFPPTPESRTQLLGDYSEFTENVLYRARDELRGEQEDNDRPRMAIFNPEDCHPKVLLSCGGHCAALEHAVAGESSSPGSSKGSSSGNNKNAPQNQSSSSNVQRIYRSVRAALSFQNGRTTYLEFCAMWAPNERVAHLAAPQQRPPLHLCVGLSTKAMPLRNTVPGCSPRTIGLDSSGTLLLSGRRTKTTGFSYVSVVGVCIKTMPSHLLVSFFVDGKKVFCEPTELGVNLCDDHDNEEFKPDLTSVFSIKCTEENAGMPEQQLQQQQYFPTVSIKSNGCKVFAHYSAADMYHTESTADFWHDIAAFAQGGALYALDGTMLPCSSLKCKSSPESTPPPPSSTSPALAIKK